VKVWCALLFLSGFGCVAPLSSLTRVTTIATRSAHLTLKSAPEAIKDEARVRDALGRSVAKLERWGSLAVDVTVHIAPTHSALERAVGRQGYDWLRAWARYDELIIQSPSSWAGSDRDVDELVVHELTHCLLFQRSGNSKTWESKQIPFWFREGLATVTADQGLRYPSLEDLADWIQSNSGLDVFGDAERLSRKAYAQIYGTSFHAMRFLLKRVGDRAIVEMMAAMRQGENFEGAFARATGTTQRRFEVDFLNYLRFRGFRGFGLKVTTPRPP
jgi:hypothetical protein